MSATTDLKAAILKEFGKCRHNITLNYMNFDPCPCWRGNDCPHFPEFSRECLAAGITELESLARKQHKADVQFATYGRGDATLLPSTWINETASSLDLDLTWIEDGPGMEREGERQLRQVLGVLRLLNTYCYQERRKLPARWSEYIREVVQPELAEGV